MHWCSMFEQGDSISENGGSGTECGRPLKPDSGVRQVGENTTLKYSWEDERDTLHR